MIYNKIEIGTEVYDLSFREYGVVSKKLPIDSDKTYIIEVKFKTRSINKIYTIDGRLFPDQKIRLVEEEPAEHIEQRTKAKAELDKRTNDFKNELKELLEKHNASISFEVSDCSDTYGIYNEHFAVDFNDIKATQPLNSEGSWSLESSDI